MTAYLVSGGTPQEVVEVKGFDHLRQRVLVVCLPDPTPRWVSLTKPYCPPDTVSGPERKKP